MASFLPGHNFIGFLYIALYILGTTVAGVVDLAHYILPKKAA
jgi:hypothetical protein